MHNLVYITIMIYIIHTYTRAKLASKVRYTAQSVCMFCCLFGGLPRAEITVLEPEQMFSSEVAYLSSKIHLLINKHNRENFFCYT
jgi:hypothetical protein